MHMIAGERRTVTHPPERFLPIFAFPESVLLPPKAIAPFEQSPISITDFAEPPHT